MRFIQGSHRDAIHYISKRLREALGEGSPVLWLISGGSNIPIQKAVMDTLPNDLTKSLTIIPVDERYGPYGHKHSNTAKLRKAGFDPKHAELIDVLEGNLSPGETINLYKDFIARKIATGDYVFITLGMGEDGHIAGILPNSPPLFSTELAIYYKAPDYGRITLCADTIAAHCNEAVLCAYGDHKAKALLALSRHADNREQVPAMILQELADCTVFNDSIQGETV